MAKYANQNLVAFGVHNGLIPTDGPKSMAIPLDFTSILTYELELEVAAEMGRLPFWQSVYIDNSMNATQSLVLTMQETQQTIKVKPSTQGFYPVLGGSTKLTATLSAVGSAATLIILCSMPMPAASWATA